MEIKCFIWVFILQIVQCNNVINQREFNGESQSDLVPIKQLLWKPYHQPPETRREFGGAKAGIGFNIRDVNKGAVTREFESREYKDPVFNMDGLKMATHLLLRVVFAPYFIADFAARKAGSFIWEEASYALEKLGGSPRNRTSDAIKERLLKEVNAKIYFQSGDSEEYKLEEEDGGKYKTSCRSFNNKPINFVLPQDSCVRLFKYEDCRGPSLAIYPGSKLSSSLPTQFLTIGRCMPTEFDFSLFHDGPNGISAEKDLWNAEVIPDYLVDQSGADYFPRFSARPKDPATGNMGPHFYFDQGGRLKWAGGKIFRPYLSAENSTVLKESQRWVSLDKKQGDELGLVFPPFLGGSTSDIQNIFAQSKDNLHKWYGIMEEVRETLRSAGKHWILELDLSVTMAYESERTNRPFGFYYYLVVDMDFKWGESRNIQYGFIRN